MDLVVTPEPHYIPGYTGHCPKYQFRPGKTYGKLTHKLLIDPCSRHAPELIVPPLHRKPTSEEKPSPHKINILLAREKYIDAVYRYPILPGYDGHIPNMYKNFGKRFLAASVSGLAEHEMLMDRYRCERRNLVHRDLLGSGQGVFEVQLNERMLPMTKYRSPLIPVKPRGEAIQVYESCEDYREPKEPYSKHTPPIFMDDCDEEKYMKSGYAGHIPMARRRFGESHQPLTNLALCDFLHHLKHYQTEKYCPLEMPRVDPECPRVGHFIVYPDRTGVKPNYAGHVPGVSFIFGKTFGQASVNAKGWLEKHAAKPMEPDFKNLNIIERKLIYE